MHDVVRKAGKFVSIHSCGDFDELIPIGVNCFNPFRPEVMDVGTLMRAYRGRPAFHPAFHGGLSTQRVLPYDTPDELRRERRRLLRLGKEGGYILAPAHAVEGDVPLENMLAFIEEARRQPGYGG